MTTTRKNWKPQKNKREQEKMEDMDEEEYSFQKRLPSTFPRRKNDVYVNQKSSFPAQFNKCKTLLSNEKEVCIHGLGAAVNKAVNLALQLNTFYLNTLMVSTTTSSVELIDDFTPITAKGRSRTSSRKNSAIHIKLTQVMPANT